MRKLILPSVALVAMTVSACSGGSDPMTCSSERASNTLRDLIQTKIVDPFTEAQRKAANDMIVALTPDYQRIKQNLADRISGQCAAHNPTDQERRGWCETVVPEYLVRAEDQIMPYKSTIAKITADPILFEVRGIITTDKTERRATCKASIHWSSAKGQWAFSTNDDSFTFWVEKTDAGELYVTAHGLGQSLQ